MTALSAIQSASSVLGVAPPSSVFGSADTTARKLADCAQQVAEYIAEEHEWQTLKRRATFTGNGVTDAFDLPDDFSRLPKKMSIQSSRLELELSHVPDDDDWLELVTEDYQIAVGAWRLLGGQMVFYPPLQSAETATFFYITSEIVIGEDLTTKPAFTSDTDRFRLNERLLDLGIRWLWRQSKGLPYAEELATFSAALAKHVMWDRGSRTIKVGRASISDDVSVAYPRSVLG